MLLIKQRSAKEKTTLYSEKKISGKCIFCYFFVHDKYLNWLKTVALLREPSNTK